MYVSGSDGNLYLESSNGMFTGSLYKTRYVEVSGSHTIEDDDVETVPGILYDQANNLYWLDARSSNATLWDGTTTFDSGSNEGCIWFYDLTDSQKNTIENDAQYIATYVTSSL